MRAHQRERERERERESIPAITLTTGNFAKLGLSTRSDSRAGSGAQEERDNMNTNALSPLWESVEKTRMGLAWLSTIFDLGIRIWVAQVFFKSGLTKIDNWDSTVFLFGNVYSVPVLPPEVAALLATTAELGLPVLLLIGFATRLGALGLFILNYVAVISFPDMGAVGIKDHILWGVMLAMIFFHGPGRIAIDEWLLRRLTPR
jgi:putative oxidoreductase